MLFSTDPLSLSLSLSLEDFMILYPEKDILETLYVTNKETFFTYKIRVRTRKCYKFYLLYSIPFQRVSRYITLCCLTGRYQGFRIRTEQDPDPTSDLKRTYCHYFAPLSFTIILILIAIFFVLKLG